MTDRMRALFRYCRLMRDNYRWGVTADRRLEADEIFDMLFPDDVWSPEQELLSQRLEAFYERLHGWANKYVRRRMYQYATLLSSRSST